MLPSDKVKDSIKLLLALLFATGVAITAGVEMLPKNASAAPAVNQYIKEYVASQFIPPGGCVAGVTCTAGGFVTTGNITAANGVFTGRVDAVTFVASGNMTAVNYTASGNITAASGFQTAGNVTAVRFSGTTFVATGNVTAVDMTASGNVTAATFSATSTTVPNLTCNAATGEECITAKRGARIYMDFDNSTTSNYISYTSADDSISFNSMGLNAGNATVRTGSVVRDVDSSPLTYGGTAADSAGTSTHFMYHTNTTGTNDDANILALVNGSSGANIVTRFRRESGGIQVLGYATASLPSCNSNNLANSTGTLGLLLFDTTSNTWKYCNGTAWVENGGALTGSATVDFGSISQATCADSTTITVTGAAAGDRVTLGTPNGAMVTGSQFQAWANTTDQVTVRHCCIGAATCDPASGTFKVSVQK